MRVIVTLCTLLAASLPIGLTAQQVDRTEEPSTSPLYEAARTGDLAAIERLLGEGADPDLGVIFDDASESRDTPLGIALKVRPDELEEVVRLLLDAGADPNLSFWEGLDAAAPLHVAADVAARTSSEVVRLLLEAGADPNVYQCGGGSWLSTPLGKVDRDSEVADLLRAAGAEDPFVSGAELAVVKNSAAAPLHAAVWQRDPAAAIRLLEEGSDPNAAITGRRLVNGEVERFTPLDLALEFTNEAPFEAGTEGEPPFIEEIVRVLLEAGADPNAPFELVCTVEWPAPLTTAIQHGSVNLVKLLLEAGADPNTTLDFTFQGTPESHPTLVLALEWGSEGIDMMRLLLAAGADPDHGWVYGDEPSIPPLFSTLSVLGNEGIDVVRLLLDSGADPNLQIGSGDESYTLLALASELGLTEIEALLKAAGAEELPAATEPTAPPGDFEASFASCTPGAAMRASMDPLAVQVRYEILGPEDEGCRVSLTYETNPNPAWENQPLLFTLDHSQPFEEEVEAGFRACLTGEDTRFDCGGPFLAIIRR